jgi:hypothetical protein
MSKEKRKRSAHPVINKGYYHGIHNDVHLRTGITKPVIHAALKNNDTSTPKRLEAIKAALEIINERQLQSA